MTRFLILSFVLFCLVGCGDSPAPVDADEDAAEAGAAEDAAADLDAPAAEDAPASDDAVTADDAQDAPASE